MKKEEFDFKINLIFHHEEEILKVKALNYKNLSITIRDIIEIINKEEFIYDDIGIEATLYEHDEIQILTNYAEEVNNGQIKWNLSIKDLNLNDLRKKLNIDTITFTCEDGYGDIDLDISLILKIFKAFYYICIFLIKLFNQKNKAYSIIENISMKDRQYIKKVILAQDCWSKGFICDYYFDKKNSVEKIIMKDLGYKSIENEWVKHCF